jgi:hypothetical protein
MYIYIVAIANLIGPSLKKNKLCRLPKIEGYILSFSGTHWELEGTYLEPIGNLKGTQ